MDNNDLLKAQNISITLLIITCEVYSRHSSVDIHSESTEFSVLGESSGYKNYMSCTTYEKPDGGATKLKLIIGTKTISLLITCSAELSIEPKINIGPDVEFGPWFNHGFKLQNPLDEIES